MFHFKATSSRNSPNWNYFACVATLCIANFSRFSLCWANTCSYFLCNIMCWAGRIENITFIFNFTVFSIFLRRSKILRTLSVITFRSIAPYRNEFYRKVFARLYVYFVCSIFTTEICVFTCSHCIRLTL